MCRYGMHTYKSRLVCLTCRSTFKKAGGPADGDDRCPRCRAAMVDAGRDLAVPRRRDAAGWRTLETVLRSGLTFHSCGCGGPGYRPRTWAEVRERQTAAGRLGIPLRASLARRDPWEPE
jgi:hypothetical protein